MSNQAGTTSNFSIHPGTQIGPVSLTISNLERSLAFYEHVLGFPCIQRDEHTAVLGVGIPLLLLTEQPGARPKPPHTTGLYHFAILVPGRTDLARSLYHLRELAYAVREALDHSVSEAIYLDDPDGNGIEIYRDRPRSAWPWHDGKLDGTHASTPLDVESVLSELEGNDHSWQGLPSQTRIGHIHLQVADLDAAANFYQGVLSFDEAITGVTGALFLAADGYHHHLGLNTWECLGAPPPPADAAGLRFFTICLPDMEELTRISKRLLAASIPLIQKPKALIFRDPVGNGILMTAGAIQSGKEVMSFTEACI